MLPTDVKCVCAFIWAIHVATDERPPLSQARNWSQLTASVVDCAHRTSSSQGCLELLL